MTYESDPMGAALDRHITGNWGEDSVSPEPCDDECERIPCPFDYDRAACREDHEIDLAIELKRDQEMED